VLGRVYNVRAFQDGTGSFAFVAPEYRPWLLISEFARVVVCFLVRLRSMHHNKFGDTPRDFNRTRRKIQEDVHS
jgi:hypothetical protein